MSWAGAGRGADGADERAGAGRSAMTGAPTAALGAGAGRDAGEPPSRTTSSSWKRRPPGPSLAGSIAASRRPIAVSRAAPGSVAARQAGHESRADGFHDLVEECPHVPAALVEAVEDRQARQALTIDQRRDEPVDRLAAGQAERVPDPVRAEAVRVAGQELVEHRLGVPHPARGGPGDEVDRVVVRLAGPISARMWRSLPAICSTLSLRKS